MGNNFSRRKFISGAAVIGAAGVTGFNPLTACADGSKSNVSLITGQPFKGLDQLSIPPLLEAAPDGPVLKAGVIGCGGRGSGAATDWLSAGPNVTITALGDVFKDRIDSCREKIKKQFNLEVPEENCFVGFDAFQKVIDSGKQVYLYLERNDEELYQNTINKLSEENSNPFISERTPVYKNPATNEIIYQLQFSFSEVQPKTNTD